MNKRKIVLNGEFAKIPLADADPRSLSREGDIQAMAAVISRYASPNINKTTGRAYTSLGIAEAAFDATYSLKEVNAYRNIVDKFLTKLSDICRDTTLDAATDSEILAYGMWAAETLRNAEESKSDDKAQAAKNFIRVLVRLVSYEPALYNKFLVDMKQQLKQRG